MHRLHTFTVTAANMHHYDTVVSNQVNAPAMPKTALSGRSHFCRNSTISAWVMPATWAAVGLLAKTLSGPYTSFFSSRGGMTAVLSFRCVIRFSICMLQKRGYHTWIRSTKVQGGRRAGGLVFSAGGCRGVLFQGIDDNSHTSQ